MANNTVFDNKIIEAKAKDLLLTSLNFRSLMAVDTSLAESEGMVKQINVYKYTGEAEVIERDGYSDGKNSDGARGYITYTPVEHRVKRVQQVFDYYDKDFLMDSNVVDFSLKGANQVMVNKMTEDFITQAKTATLSSEAATFGYEAIVEAISKLSIEDESALFIVAPNAWKAELRLDEDYKVARMGEVIYNG